jgi:hypothetical protein
MKQLITILLALVSFTVSAQATGDYLLNRKKSTAGFDGTWITPGAFGLMGFDGTGALTNVATSAGGNDYTDAGKVATYGTEGQLRGSTDGSNAAIWGSSIGTGYAGYFTAASNLWPAVYINGSGSGTFGLEIEKSGGGVALHASSTEKAARFHGHQSGGGGTPDIADFVTGIAETSKLTVKFDGGLEWGSTGAQTTATNLPVFGTATKGVVPASGGGTTNFLRADGTFAAPPGGGSGITQLTGDVTAGPGSGSQAATLASVIAAAGPTGSASVVPVITYDAKGRLTTVTTATITPAAIGAPSGSGTSSGTNSGDVTLAGTPDYITIAGQTITRGLIELSTDVTGTLDYARFPSVTTSTLLGRRNGSSGQPEEITLGTGLSMSGTTLNASGGSFDANKTMAYAAAY